MDCNTVDFRLLNSQSLWSLFERRSCSGGVIAYAVLSKAKKIGSLCGSSLEKSKAGRLKQADHWNQFCKQTCNLLWARRFAFSIVNDRSSFQGRLTASWSSESPHVITCVPVQYDISKAINDMARIASLAVYSLSAEFLDQVIFCSKDCRSIIIDDLWAILKRDFLCNSSWSPSHKYLFNDEISCIHPDSACSVDIDITTLRELWSTLLSYLRGIVSGRHYAPNLDAKTVWFSHICKSVIPACHHAITMWVWLLWTSNSISMILERAIKLPQTASCSTPTASSLVAVSELLSLERRIDAMLMLRSKSLITKAEFEQMRRQIINGLQEGSF
jgi:hypothetical protein